MLAEEEAIIDSIINGDANSFSLIVDEYKNMVFTLCVQMVKDKMIAEEIAQDSFLKAFRNLSSYRKESKFSTWLYKIAYNTCLSALRKRNIETVELQEYNASEKGNQGMVNLENEDRDRMLMEVLNELKEDDRVIIQLFYLEEMSIKEIKDVTGLSESNIKVKLHRTKTKLKEMIENAYPEYDRSRSA